MRPVDVLVTCATLIGERGQDYGGVEENFKRIATIASVVLGKDVSPWDVAMVLTATKLARMAGSRDKEDNYLDAINYLAFASEMRDENNTASGAGSSAGPSDGGGE